MASRRWLLLLVMVVLAVALSPSHAALGSAERSALPAAPSILADTSGPVAEAVATATGVVSSTIVEVARTAGAALPMTDAAGVAGTCLHDVTCAGAAAGAVLMAAFVLAAASNPPRARARVVLVAVAPVTATGRRAPGELFRPPRPQV